jgi:hypothetical protein
LGGGAAGRRAGWPRSGVDEVDAAVQGGVDDPDALLVIGIAPGAEHHRAGAVRGHLDPGTAERPHPHPGAAFRLVSFP